MTIAMVSKQEAAPKDRVRPDGSAYGGLDYMQPKSKGDVSPQGFTALVEKKTLRAHFHDVDQFQVMFGVPGSMYQRTPLPEVMIHYADAFVTYGPIISTDEALPYFTLRGRPTTGTWFMPESRANLPYRGRRHFEVYPETYVEGQLSDGEINTDVVIRDDKDGLEALIITGGPNAEFDIDPTAAGSGQYTVVVNGSVEYQGKSYGVESLGWQDQKDGPTSFRAGPEGCRVFVLRFPSPPTPISHQN